MAWETDLGEAVYTSPSGKRFSFNFDPKLTSETDLKTVSFTFPEKDGALVIPLGLGGRKFSMTIFFYGEDCFQKAEDFENALKERGVGSLLHPLYGLHNVVPTGSISRTDDVVAGVGVSEIGVTFSETLTEASVVSEVSKIDEIEEKIETLKKTSAKEFVKNCYLNSAKAVVKVKNAYNKAMRTVANSIGKIAETESKINELFQIAFNEIFNPLDNIINNVDMVAAQTINLIHLPSKISCNALKKIESYADCIHGIIYQFKILDTNFNNVKNQWAITCLSLSNMISACASGVAESTNNSKTENAKSESNEQGASFHVATNDKFVSNSVFSSREEAMEAIEKLQNLYDEIILFFEKFIALGLFVETGDSYESMRDCFFASINYILNKSFELPNKKTIELKSDRQVTELVFELYGNLNRLDEFIVDNKLNYNEIEIIPAGRKVAYYV